MSRFEIARKFARNIIVSKKLVPPISPLKIIGEYGFEIECKDNQYGIEAFTTLTNQPKITLNSEITFPPRVIFTLAHELGHIIIPWHNGDIKCNTDNTSFKIDGVRYLDTQELEANIFASELLMPTEWVKARISDIGGEDLKKCTLNLADSAKTSIMACFYALEQALPSGHLFYVRRKGVDDFWHPFKTRGTFSNKLSYDTEKNEKLMKKFALTYTEFEISQYEVIHYIFSPCPEPSTIVALYTEFNANATEIINVASEYNCRSILFSLRTIVESIPDKWIFCLAENDTISFTIASENCKIKIYTKQISYFKKVANRFKIKYDILSADRGYSLITIKEPSFDTAKLPKKDPNQLLKDIITDIQGNIDHKILHSINGIVSVII